MEAHPLTGRTHQIRLHMNFISARWWAIRSTVTGTPRLPMERFLHAGRIKITLPGETQARTFEAPLPAELAVILDELLGENLATHWKHR